ncbi:MAG: glycosyltransferase [candidate division WOR-3 bacterium]|nr:MAG: glycosyltransferase [candidate division WOR-3 bacterium]
MKKDLSVVIVNYNVKAFLEQCLMAIDRARGDIDIEVFVVDNASVDGSQALVKKKFPHVRLIENTTNIGFSAANNQALRHANGDYVLLLNPDTLIQEDTLKVLITYLNERPDVGAVGCKLLNPDGSFQISSRRSFPTPWVAFCRIVGLSRIFPRSRLFGKYNVGYVDADTETEVDVLSGSLMMLRKSVLDHVGYFDEDYFMYGEDIDLSYRIKAAGWKIMYTPFTKAIHYKGESTKKSEFSSIANFYSTMLIFVNKHIGGRYSFLLRILLTMGIYVRAVMAFLWQTVKNLAPPLVDLSFILLSLLLAIRIRFPHYPLERFNIVVPVYTFVWMSSIYLFRAYRGKEVFPLKPVLGGCVLGLLVNSTFTYFFKQFAYSRIVVLISFLLIFILMALWRVVYRVAGPGARRAPLSRLRRAIIIGAGKEGKRILNKLRSRPDMHYEICGFVDFDTQNIGKEIDGTEVLATTDSIKDVIRVERIDEVIFSSDRLTNAQILETIIRAQGSGVNFRIVPHEVEYIVAKSSVDDIESVPLLNITGFAGPLDLIVKRIFDFGTAVGIVIIISPLVLLNLLIGGRFIQRNIFGTGGKSLAVPLFEGGMAFMKKVPLLFSVLTGKLSIVGSEMIDFKPGKFYPTYKPGLTGLVQVKMREKKGTLKQNEKDYYNLYYIKNQSIITDMQLIMKSIF